MKKLTLLYIFTCLFLTSKSQSDLIKKELLLPSSLGSKDSCYEFSSLGTWENNILLIPSLKRCAPPYQPEIYYIKRSEIQAALIDDTNIKAVEKISIDADDYKEYFLKVKCYNGIEASVVIDSTIFFSIETAGEAGCHNKDCFIVKGYIKKRQGQNPIIKIDTSISIQKAPIYVTLNKDAGFEGLTFYKQKLLAIFEYDSAGKGFAYEIDTSLREKTQVSIPQMLNNRLADVSTLDNYGLIGIDSHFNKDNSLQNKYDIVQIKTDTIISLIEISKGKKELNWEGIVPFNDGFLLINDNKFVGDNDKTKLLYLLKK